MAMSTPHFIYLRDLVKERSGIVIGDDKSYLIESRLAPLAKAKNLANVEALATMLRQTPYGPVHRAVVDAMTTNETFFFRDVHPFEVFRKDILPTMITNRRQLKRLNVWCAAASSGQEPYSLAMIMRRHFPELPTWNVHFTATDISTEMIKRCQNGIFSALETDRGLAPDLKSAYFTQQGVDFQIRDEIRRMITFQVLNLLEPWAFAHASLDIVFCRNVLIYFDNPTKSKILARIRKAMAPDGFLFLGGAETTLGLDEGFERAPFEKAGCFRLKKA